MVKESDLANTISRVSSPAVFPWRFQFYLNELSLCLLKIQVVFEQSANVFADTKENKGWIDLLL